MAGKFFRQSAEPGIIEERGRGIYLDAGPTVPADATVGYSPGCIFIKNNGAIGSQFYINTSTFNSSAFKLLAGVDLSGLLATAAEINRVAQVSTRTVTAITTLAVTQALHENRTILLSLLAGFTSTLPASTGGGAIYKFVIGIVNTTNNYIIAAAGADVFKGSIGITVPGSTWATAAKGETFASTANQTITLSGLATGGATIGDYVVVQDIQAGVWAVNGWVTATTTPLTMFS